MPASISTAGRSAKIPRRAEPPGEATSPGKRRRLVDTARDGGYPDAVPLHRFAVALVLAAAASAASTAEHPDEAARRAEAAAARAEAAAARSEAAAERVEAAIGRLEALLARVEAGERARDRGR